MRLNPGIKSSSYVEQVLYISVLRKETYIAE
jgi:hypothetical protein